MFVAFSSPEQGKVGTREVVITGGVILLLFCVVIPMLLSRRMGANEQAALATVRSLMLAEKNLAGTSGNGYAPLNRLILESKQGRIPPLEADLALGVSRGYRFTILLGSEDGGFSVAAWPVRYLRTGRRSFYTDASGVVRAGKNGGTPGTPDLPVLAEP